MQGPAVIPVRGARSHTPCGEVKQQIKWLIRYHMNFPSIKRKCKNPIKQAEPRPRPACRCDSHPLQSRSTSEAPQAGPWPPGCPSCRWPWAHDPSFSAAHRAPHPQGSHKPPSKGHPGRRGTTPWGQRHQPVFPVHQLLTAHQPWWDPQTRHPRWTRGLHAIATFYLKRKALVWELPAGWSLTWVLATSHFL